MVARYVVLGVVALAVLLPVYTTVVAALKPGGKVLDRSFVPEHLTLSVLRDAWTEGRLGRYLWNSAIVATIVTVAQLVTSVLAAYAFAFLRFPLKAFWFTVFLATLLVPLETTLVVNRRTIDHQLPHFAAGLIRRLDQRDLHIALSENADEFVSLIGFLDSFDGFFPSYRNGNHHSGKENIIAQRQDRQDFREVFLGKFFIFINGKHGNHFHFLIHDIL
jgi:ABC-type sugar transport system permease subunit